MRLKFVLIALISIAAIAALAFVFIFIIGTNQVGSQAIYCYPGNVTPIFSPDNSEIIYSLIGSARHDMKLEVYEFSSKDLADALISARTNGVAVEVILEPSVSQNSAMMNYLVNHGIDASWASKKFHNTHSKFMIVDSSIVLVGSINWSENAMKYNREADVIVYSKEIASEFEKIFDSDFNNS